MVRVRLARDVAIQELLSARAGGLGFEEGAQFRGERGVVGERELFGVRFEEEIERIEDRHFGDQIHFDEEFAWWVRGRPGARGSWPAGPAAS